MSDGRDVMGCPTNQTHCDRCRKKAFIFHESRYWYKGSICGNCSYEVRRDRLLWEEGFKDFTVNQTEPLDDFCDY